MSVQTWPLTKAFRIALYMVLSTLLLPILLVATVPVLIFRQLSKVSIKKLHKDSDHIGEILHPVAQSIAHDSFTPNPRLNIVGCWIGEGSLSIESLREQFTKNILGSKVADGKGSSKLEYPELTSHVIKYGGYFYHKQIRDFDIKNYVRPYHHGPSEKRITRQSDLKKIVAQLTAKGWSKDRSPWEALLINNYVDSDTITHTEGAKAPNFKPKTVIILRIHHTLADGYTLLRMLKLMSTGEFKTSADFKKNSGLIVALKRIFLAPILFPYNMAMLIEEFTSQPSTSWMMSSEKQKKAGRTLHQEWAGAIPLEAIKRIKNTYGVSFQAVLNCVVGGAIQKLTAGMKKKVPQVMPAVLPLPLPGHPGGCVNHFGYILTHLLVGEADPVKRLKSSEDQLRKLSKSLPFMAFVLYNFVGLFPLAVTKLMTKADIGCSVMFSPFQTFDSVNYVGNCRATEIFFTIGTGLGASGTSIIACSSYGKIRFGITMDEQVHSSAENVAKFDEFIQSEIKALLKNIEYL